MRHSIAAIFATLLIWSIPASAEDAKPFADNHDIDLVGILPPPPPNESAVTRHELGEVLMIQVTRTPEMVEHAKADDEEDVWRFIDVVGPGLTKDKLPRFSAFFERIAATEGAVVDPAKKIYGRPRPYQLSPLVEPVIEKSKSPAWPSGHATLGTLIGIELANMVPEKRREIMDRAWEYAHNRIVAGMHFPSDVNMGHIAGSAISVEISKKPDFQSEFEAAKHELRAALRLGA